MNKKTSIKEIPKDCRPYERCFKYGPGVLSDAELLGVILRTGACGTTSVELAQQIFRLADEEGILGICRLTADKLMKVKGIGMVKTVQILCIVELSRRISMAQRAKRLSFQSPAAVADYYMEEMRHKTTEELKVLMLDSKGALIAERTISKGTVNAAVASPREIFLEALKVEAVNILVMHNHPSGDPTPSQSDVVCTRKIREAGEIIGISLTDHIIIGDNRYMSFSEQGLL